MKRSILFISLLFTSLYYSTAQSNTADSLLAVLKNAEDDTNKVNTLNILSYELLYSNTDTTIYFATMARDLAEKLGYSKGIASAYLRLGQAYNNLGS